MPYESYTQALRPKVQGTWNLHEMLSKTDLDFFVMLSSGAGVFGNGGQANYAAGSTFLDAIARHRTSLGLPAVSLDLGVIESVGYVAQNKELAARLERQGHMAIRENELLLLIQSAIMDRPQNVQESQTITGLTVGQDTAPWLRHDAKFSLVRMQQKASSPAGTDEDNEAKSLQSQLSRVESTQDAIGIISKAIATKLSNDFMIAESDINPDAPLSSYGVDSLVAVELRNWILTQARAEISIFDVLQSKTLIVLAEKVAVKSGCVAEKVKVETEGGGSK
jgi:acyl carrier protein